MSSAHTAQPGDTLLRVAAESVECPGQLIGRLRALEQANYPVLLFPVRPRRVVKASVRRLAQTESAAL